jgi:hypothetical protein
MRATFLVRCVLVGALGSGCVSGSNQVTAEDEQRLRAYVLDQAPANVKRKLNTDFDGKVTLLGYDLEPAGPVGAAQKIRLTLYWECKAEVGDGWNLFTHVLDASGERILNIDNVGPLREWRETHQLLWPTAWKPGKFYVDEQEFTLPANVRTSTVQLVTGIWKGNERMPIRSGPKDREGRAVVANVPVRGTGGAPSTRSTRAPQLRCDRMPAGTSIKIDGKLDEPAWQTAASTGPFVDVSTGDENRSQDLGGSVRLLWDEQALYLGFDVRDTNLLGGFDAHATDPHLWTRDTVEVMVDPDGDGDNQDYYEIQISPQNLVFDSRFDRYNEPKVEPDGPFGHQDWSAKLQSAVVVKGTLDDGQDRDEGYVVEARIPWTAFDKAKRAPPQLGDRWRINFYAMERNGGVAWSPILRQGNFHKASRFGYVTWAEPGWTPPYSGYGPVPSAAPSASASPEPRKPRRP